MEVFCKQYKINTSEKCLGCDKDCKPTIDAESYNKAINDAIAVCGPWAHAAQERIKKLLK